MGCWSLPAGAPPPPGAQLYSVLSQVVGQLVVRLGEWDAGHSQQEPHPHQEVPAQRLIIHPEFFPGGLFFDIALIILAHGADVSRWAARVQTTRRTLKPILISRGGPFNGSQWEVIETSASVFIGFFKEVILQPMCHHFC